jgi:hypothetical protein
MTDQKGGNARRGPGRPPKKSRGGGRLETTTKETGESEGSVVPARRGRGRPRAARGSAQATATAPTLTGAPEPISTPVPTDDYAPA